MTDDEEELEKIANSMLVGEGGLKRGNVSPIKNRKVNGAVERNCSKCFEWKPLDKFYFKLSPDPRFPEIKPIYQEACVDCQKLAYKKRAQTPKAKR